MRPAFPTAQCWRIASAAGSPITVLHIHTVNDRNYPYAGGVGNDGISATNCYGVDATITNWIARNNVTNQATEERIGASTACRRYATPCQPMEFSRVRRFSFAGPIRRTSMTL